MYGSIVCVIVVSSIFVLLEFWLENRFWVCILLFDNVSSQVGDCWYCCWWWLDWDASCRLVEIIDTGYGDKFAWDCWDIFWFCQFIISVLLIDRTS